MTKQEEAAEIVKVLYSSFDLDGLITILEVGERYEAPAARSSDPSVLEAVMAMNAALRHEIKRRSFEVQA